MAVSRDELFKARLAEREVEIPGIGTVRIRALSRQEVLDFRKRKTADGDPLGDDAAAFERALVSTAMVDPQLSEDDVRQWQAASDAGELEPVTEAIAELSGMNKGASKQAVKQFRD